MQLREARVEQQPPAFIKAHARAPGMDLLDAWTAQEGPGQMNKGEKMLKTESTVWLIISL